MAAQEPSAARVNELVTDVLAPLVLGGAVLPVRPFGPSLAVRIGGTREVIDADLRSRLDVARVRRARVVAPVDVLPDVSAAELALVAALNDLLQATNHEIGGRFTVSRYGRLLAGVVETCENVAAPDSVMSALARHATFARVLELTRTDTMVSWWTGRASFRGQAPPPRLLAWKSLRRVHVDEQKIALVEMCQGFAGADEARFCDALAVWLTRSPLTDIGTLTRRAPPFAWSSSTLSLISATPGRTLAWRLLARREPALVLSSLERAGAGIPATFERERALASAFAAEVAAGFKALGSSAAKGETGRSLRASAKVPTPG